MTDDKLTKGILEVRLEDEHTAQCLPKGQMESSAIHWVSS